MFVYIGVGVNVALCTCVDVGLCVFKCQEPFSSAYFPVRKLRINPEKGDVRPLARLSLEVLPASVQVVVEVLRWRFFGHVSHVAVYL